MGALDDIIRAVATGATGYHGAPAQPEPDLYETGSPLDVGVRAAGDMAGTIGDIAGAVHGGIAHAVDPRTSIGLGRDLGNYLSRAPRPTAPPAPMMRPTPRPAPPSSRGVALRPTGEAVKERDERARATTSSSTEGGTATGAANPSVAGAPPRIPAWMAAGSQPRFGGPAPAQDAAAERLAANLGPGETLSRNLPGSMANVLSDIGFDQAMDARDRATLARTNTSIEQEKAAQVLDDLTGGTQKRIRADALTHVLEDMQPAGSQGFVRGWDANGRQLQSDAIGQTPLGQPTIGEEKEMDRIIASQGGKTAGVREAHDVRQAQLQLIDDLRKKQKIIKDRLQVRLSAGEFGHAADPKTLKAVQDAYQEEFGREQRLTDRELQALGGGRDFLSQYKNDVGGNDSVFSITPDKHDE